MLGFAVLTVIWLFWKVKKKGKEERERRKGKKRREGEKEAKMRNRIERRKSHTKIQHTFVCCLFAF